MNIPIHKHTPVRRRHSMYRTTILVDTFINGIPLLYSTDIPRTGVIPIVHTGTTKGSNVRITKATTYINGYRCNLDETQNTVDELIREQLTEHIEADKWKDLKQAFNKRKSPWWSRRKKK